MKKEKFHELIVKYINKSINSDELDLFNSYLDNKEFDELFRSYIEANYIADLAYNRYNTTQAKKELIATIRKNKIIPLYKRQFFKYAAAILIFVSAGYFFLTKNNNTQITGPTIVNNTIKIGTDKATLTLEDGTNVILEKGETYSADNINSTGEEIIYKTSDKPKQEIAYNYLTIPRGGQYFVKLSDGTQVWLNSETKLKYPVNFIEGKTRQVELVYGEAYFDVSPSTEHKGSKFKVQTGIQEIEVLGTEFNIKAYEGDSNISTTLVEGKVEISNEIYNEILMPGLQSNVNIKTNKISLAKVDVMNAVAWKNGFFSFEKETLDKMLKTLARWYDVEIIYENKEKANLIFSGVLKRTNKVEELLENIEKTDRVKFEINNKQITVK